MTLAKRPSSRRWQQRHQRDPFVRRAQQVGFRSRAAFKLQEIQSRDRLLRRGAFVVDLGAAPGGWSQVAAELVGSSGRVVAVDLLQMAPLAGVEHIRGDLADEEVIREIGRRLGGRCADLVMSDMAPNISGNWSVDQPRAMRLAELALEVARRCLKPGGSALIKAFQGEGLRELVAAARASFGAVRLRKPPASRSESREIYLLARNYRL
jgi:23S rRNA (uridine2552-2'-O)-methyltransferase